MVHFKLVGNFMLLFCYYNLQRLFLDNIDSLVNIWPLTTKKIDP